MAVNITNQPQEVRIQPKRPYKESPGLSAAKKFTKDNNPAPPGKGSNKRPPNEADKENKPSKKQKTEPQSNNTSKDKSNKPLSYADDAALRQADHLVQDFKNFQNDTAQPNMNNFAIAAGELRNHLVRKGASTDSALKAIENMRPRGGDGARLMKTDKELQNNPLLKKATETKQPDSKLKKISQSANVNAKNIEGKISDVRSLPDKAPHTPNVARKQGVGRSLN